MPIRKSKSGKYLPWYFDQENKGKARLRRARPKRDILSVRIALNNLKLSYCSEVSFWNPLHTGKHGDLDGGLQWVDLVAKGKRPIPIILDDPRKRFKEYEKDYLRNKQTGLLERGLVPLILPAHRTSQEYQILVFRHMKRNNL